MTGMFASWSAATTAPARAGPLDEIESISGLPFARARAHSLARSLVRLLPRVHKTPCERKANAPVSHYHLPRNPAAANPVVGDMAFLSRAHSNPSCPPCSCRRIIPSSLPISFSLSHSLSFPLTLPPRSTTVRSAQRRFTNDGVLLWNMNARTKYQNLWLPRHVA